jgi:hypothetical protein
MGGRAGRTGLWTGLLDSSPQLLCWLDPVHAQSNLIIGSREELLF